MTKIPALTWRIPAAIAFFGCVSLFGQVVRGPYLQLGTPTSVVVKWRTGSPSDSKVSYGADPTALTSSVTDGTSTTEHEVTVPGLTPDMKYFYSVGTTGGTLTGGDSDHYFITSPPTGTAKKTRLWLIGDAGTANADARAVRDAYLGFLDAENTDLLLMLGDNAYNDGTDSEYQGAVFDMYPQLLRNMVTWSTLGNHDGHTADSATQTGPYYDIFTLPTAGEAGGLASGTEAYYSFDYGNIHFVCLDSHETPRNVGGAMMTWLAADLQANTQPWVIAFWHHPPYSKGSHNSDQESQLVDMRENALPILEAYGVDLVFSGHSHSYERSYFIDGHYGLSGTFVAAPPMQKDAGSGQEENSGAYSKSTAIQSSHEGAVYTVAGSSGKVSGGSLDHAAMFFSISSLGSVVVDVNGNRLDATFLDANGIIQDYYTLFKGADTTAPELTAAEAALDPTQVVAVFSEPLEPTSAQAIGNYFIDQGVTVMAASLNADRKTVLLTTSPVPAGIPHSLTVNSVADHSSNAIAPNSSQSFQFENFQQYNFQDGVSPDASYDGTTDTYLSEEFPALNSGAGDTLLVDGSDPSPYDRLSLIRWDISAIPTNFTVQSADIIFNVTNPTPGAYQVYQAKRAWEEGVATWTTAASGSLWETPGAQGPSDRGATVLGELAADATGTYTLALNAEGVAVVQSWVNDPLANVGLVIANSDEGDGVDLDSSDAGTAGNRPILSITSIPANDPAMHVSNIAMSRKVTGKTHFAKATVTVRDESGNPVEGATVGGEWSGLATNIQTLTTSSTGNVQFDSDRIDKNIPGSFTLTVVNVISAGMTYDPADNVETWDCITSGGLACGPPDTDPPAAPTGLVATAGPLSATLDWDDNTEGDLADYHVFRSQVPSVFTDPAIAQIGPTSNYTDTGLLEGVTYYYIVKAEDASGNLSAASNEDSAVPTGSTATMMHVENTQVQVIPRGKRYFGRGEVTILDGDSNGVSNATVDGTWTMPDGSSVPDSGTTDAAGRAIIDSPKMAASTGQSFAFAVGGVTHPTIPYDSSANGPTSDSDVVP